MAVDAQLITVAEGVILASLYDPPGNRGGGFRNAPDLGDNGGDSGALIASGADSGVAVGTLVSRRPPLRSVRAELPHTAPALGHDAYLGFGCG